MIGVYLRMPAAPSRSASVSGAAAVLAPRGLATEQAVAIRQAMRRRFDECLAQSTAEELENDVTRFSPNEALYVRNCTAP